MSSSDATTIPLDQPLDGARSGLIGRLRGRRERAAALSGVRAGGVALCMIVLLCLMVVVLAANRPSLLAPTTHYGFYPRWMAGPFGGLVPWMTQNSTVLKDLFTGALVVMYGGYLVVLRSAPRLPTRWLVGAILAVHAIFLLSPPLALTDVFNYINYGRMEVLHNLNPYTTIPVYEPHSEPSFILSNWHELLSPYGPMFTLLTFVVVPLGVAGSFWALKAVLGLASLATIFLVWRCAQMLGRNPRSAIALLGLNPIVLVWGLGGDHNDFLMILCIMLGFYLLLRGRSSADARSAEARRGHVRSAEEGHPESRLQWLIREVWAALRAPAPADMGAGAAFVLAAGFKASGAVLLPVVLAGLLRTPRRIPHVVLGMILMSATVGAMSLAAFGLHIPDLSTQSRLVTGESIPNLIGLALGAGGESEALRYLMSGALIASVALCCWLAWKRRDAITASGWASVALLVTLSWVLPWYVLWVLPLAALSTSRRLRTAALVIGVYMIVVWVPISGGIWHAIGFRPENTPLGRLHQRYVREYLN